MKEVNNYSNKNETESESELLLSEKRETTTEQSKETSKTTNFYTKEIYATGEIANSIATDLFSGKIDSIDSVKYEESEEEDEEYFDCDINSNYSDDNPSINNDESYNQPPITIYLAPEKREAYEVLLEKVKANQWSKKQFLKEFALLIGAGAFAFMPAMGSYDCGKTSAEKILNYLKADEDSFLAIVFAETTGPIAGLSNFALYANNNISFYKFAQSNKVKVLDKNTVGFSRATFAWSLAMGGALAALSVASVNALGETNWVPLRQATSFLATWIFNVPLHLMFALNLYLRIILPFDQAEYSRTLHRLSDHLVDKSAEEQIELLLEILREEAAIRRDEIVNTLNDDGVAQQGKQNILKNYLDNLSLAEKQALVLNFCSDEQLYTKYSVLIRTINGEVFDPDFEIEEALNDCLNYILSNLSNTLIDKILTDDDFFHSNHRRLIQTLKDENITANERVRILFNTLRQLPDEEMFKIANLLAVKCNIEKESDLKRLLLYMLYINTGTIGLAASSIPNYYAQQRGEKLIFEAVLNMILALIPTPSDIQTANISEIIANATSWYPSIAKSLIYISAQINFADLIYKSPYLAKLFWHLPTTNKMVALAPAVIAALSLTESGACYMEAAVTALSDIFGVNVKALSTLDILYLLICNYGAASVNTLGFTSIMMNTAMKWTNIACNKIINLCNKSLAFFWPNDSSKRLNEQRMPGWEDLSDLLDIMSKNARKFNMTEEEQKLKKELLEHLTKKKDPKKQLTTEKYPNNNKPQELRIISSDETTPLNNPRFFSEPLPLKSTFNVYGNKESSTYASSIYGNNDDSDNSDDEDEVYYDCCSCFC